MHLSRRSVARLATALLAVSSLVVSTACGSDGPDAASAEAVDSPQVPSLMGTWTGEYEFPFGGEVVKTSLDLVIERQEGANLFGYETFVNRKGETIRIDLAGTVNVDPVDGEVEAVLVTTGFFLDIEVVSEDRLSARLVKTDDKPTTFVVDLRKKAS